MSEKNKPTPPVTRIRLFITIGYFVLCLIAFYGVFNLYSEFRSFAKNIQPEDEQIELTMVSNILASLYESENVRGTLYLDIDHKHERSIYDSIRVSIKIQVDSLQRVSSDTLIHSRLDSVSSLLDIKEDNTRQMFQLIDSINSIPLQEKAFTTVLSKQDINGLNKIYSRHLKENKDSTIVQVKKKSLAERLSDVFRSNVKDSLMVSSTQNSVLLDSILPMQLLTDTVTQYLTDVLLVQQKSKDVFMRKLSTRHHQLIRTNERITQQIRDMLYEIEARAYNKNILYLAKKEAALDRSSAIAFGVSLAALVTAILFLALSLRVIAREQRYQEQLKKAKKYAEDLLNVRERLMLTLSHDIKAPLSSIISYLELFSRCDLTSKEKYYLENIQRSSEHMLELVSKLLDYHRLDSGKQDVKKMFFSPHRLLNDLYMSYVPLAEKKGLKIEFVNQLEANMLYLSDPFRIRQILNNLLSNAVKFTDKGIVSFIATLETKESVATLNVTVRDTGCGIDNDSLEDIFEEFSRTGYSEEKGIEGSGLGLTIVKKIVALLGGEIKVKSKKGEWSEFSVRIPLTLSEDRMRNTYRDTADRKLEILFVDDDLVLLNMYTDLLKHEGFSPVVCSSSLEVLNILQKKEINIVFTDIQMPEMNGFELVEKIRNSSFEDVRNLPVIALSARSDISKKQLEESGFNGFLPKPFTFDQLFDVIVRYADVPNVREKKAVTPSSGLKALTSFAEQDAEAASNIIETFIQENKTLIEKIQSALLDEEWKSIRAYAHKLLPLMLMIGDKNVVLILLALENGSNDREQVKELVKRIGEINAEAEEYLKEINPF